MTFKRHKSNVEVFLCLTVKFWMAASGVSAEDEVSEISALEISKAMHWKDTKMQSFSDATRKMNFRSVYSDD